MNKDEALNKFTFMMEYRNLSSNTIHMYQWYLSQMFDFYHLEDVSILNVSMAQNYVVHMKKTYAPTSLNAIISAIRYFFDVVLESPLSRRQFPNILYDPVEITVFTDEQIHLLLDTKDVLNIPWWRSHPIHENRATESICTEPCNPLLRATKSMKRATSTY